MSRSARAIREAEDLYGFDAASPNWRAVSQSKIEDKPERRSGYGSLVFVALAVVFLALAMSQVPGGGPAAKPISKLPDTNPHRSGFGDTLATLIQRGTSTTLREDFHSGLSNWEGVRSANVDWSLEHGEVRPSTLRLWKPSSSLVNYEMEFMGQIEHRGMDWAFRAPDAKNYYGTKLIITRPGPLPNAGLVRFVVLDGRERERVELPLPLTLEPGVDYRVRLSVQGNRFLTSVNGQLVSSWSDARLPRGGVGFFSEDGESSLVKWVSVSDRDSFLSRIVSHFSLLTFPSAVPPAGL